MKKGISTSSALLVTAMMVTLSVGCGDGSAGDTGYIEAAQRQTTNGTCNAIVATAMGAAQQCFNSGCMPGGPACEEVTGALFGFFGNLDCATAFANDESNGLAGSASFQPAGPAAGTGKHIADVICAGVVQCGLCPVAPEGVCDPECEL
jgi:hypothetical protein